MRKRPRGASDKVGRLPPRRSSQRFFEQMLNDRFDELSRRAGREVPRRRHGRRRPEPGRRDRLARAPTCRTARSPKGWPSVAIEAKRAREFGFSAGRARSREEMDGRVLRARLHRARQDRERLVRAGVPEPLPRRGAEPGHRVSNTSWCSSCCPASPPRRSPRSARRCSPTTAASILATSPQKADIPVPTDAELKSGARGRGGDRGHAVERHDVDARAHRAQAGAGRRHRDAEGRRGRPDDREVRQRRRGVAEADRFQERPGRVRAPGEGRHVAGARRRTSSRRRWRRPTSTCRARPA